MWELNDGNDGGTCSRRVVSFARTNISLITCFPLCVSVILFFWAFSGSPNDNADQGVKWGLAVAGESIVLLIAVFHLFCATIGLLDLKHRPGIFDRRNWLKAYGVFIALTVAHLHFDRLGTTSLSHLQIYIKYTESVQGVRYSYS